MGVLVWLCEEVRKKCPQGQSYKKEWSRRNLCYPLRGTETGQTKYLPGSLFSLWESARMPAVNCRCICLVGCLTYSKWFTKWFIMIREVIHYDSFHIEQCTAIKGSQSTFYCGGFIAEWKEKHGWEAVLFALYKWQGKNLFFDARYFSAEFVLMCESFLCADSRNQAVNWCWEWWLWWGASEGQIPWSFFVRKIWLEVLPWSGRERRFCAL